jgi:hypothetical protein
LGILQGTDNKKRTKKGGRKEKSASAEAKATTFEEVPSKIKRKGNILSLNCNSGIRGSGNWQVSHGRNI